MPLDQLLAVAILAAAMVLFVRGTWRHDVVAFGALMVGVLLGVVPAETALSGFGHPAVFTVAAVLVISRALTISGVLDPVTDRLARLQDRPALQTAALVLLATGMSAFMNNVGALALVMPIALDACARAGRSPGPVLLPIAFGSVLGGLVTLIGTPPNLVVARYRAEQLGEPFGMFDFTPVGLTVAIAGALFLARFGPRLLQGREAAPAAGSRPRTELRGYIAELRVAHGSPVVGRSLAELTDAGERDLEILGMVRSEVPIYHSVDHLPLRPGDVLIVRAGSAAFQRLARVPGLDILADGPDHLVDDAARRPPLESEDTGVLEVVVPIGSRMEGRTPRSLRLHTRMGINVLAIGRHGRPFADRLADVVIRAGDVLLLQGDLEKIAETAQTYGCLPLAERGLRMTRPRHRRLPLAILALAVALTAVDVVPAHIAFGLAVVMLVVTQSFTIRQLYETVDWSVIVLLAAMIPLGRALETTGATAAFAGWIADIGGDLWPPALLVVLMAATAAVSNVINNAATAVVMAPVGFALATQLERDPDPFLLAVVIGASSAFLTPIGHQNNLLVMAPGGYRFADYPRIGLPLTALVFGVAGVALWAFG